MNLGHKFIGFLSIILWVLLMSLLLFGCKNNGKENVTPDPGPQIEIDLPSDPGPEIVIPLGVG